ncbi:MAG: excinuclease ABC subunit UvrC, partial [Evtepia sp.]
MTFEELQKKAHSLPLRPGVYLMSNATDTVIYVGKAKKLKNRVSQYFYDTTAHTEKTRAMIAQIDHFDVIVADSEFEALVLECALIKRHQPHYNILLKDGKGYPYIRLSLKEAYPTFSLVGKVAADGAGYFGPYGSRGESQALIDALRIALKLPACHKKFPRDIGKERPCLNFHMGQCDGYCQASVPAAQHAHTIRQAISLLEGKFSAVEQELTTQMETAAEMLAFEKAAMLRDRLHAISLLGKTQKVVTGKHSDTDIIGFYAGDVRAAIAVLHFKEGQLAGQDVTLFDFWDDDIISSFLMQYYTGRCVPPPEILIPTVLEDSVDLARLFSKQVGRRVTLFTPQRGAKVRLIALAEKNAREECERITTREEHSHHLLDRLAELLHLDARPKRIEAYDISNTGSSDIVAAMTVFLDGRPYRNQYRCFRVRNLETPNDYASMEQILSRRFQHLVNADTQFGDAPSLILLDGGVNHAKIGLRVLKNMNLNIPIFGMVKDDRHRFRGLTDGEG